MLAIHAEARRQDDCFYARSTPQNVYVSLTACPQLIPAFFRKDRQAFCFIDGIFPLSQVCFVNLDVNKDVCSTEHLQQVTLELRSPRAPFRGWLY